MAEADKEMVRLGRNKDFVRNNHVYQEIISAQEHENWFREMSSPSHYIMIIHFRGRDIGAIVVRDIVPDLSSTTCGAFLWDEDFIGTKIPILSILIALDFFIYHIGVMQTESIVLRKNTASIKMNKFFGFTFIDRDETSYKIILDRATYLLKRDQLNIFASRATKEKGLQKLVVTGSPSPLNLPEINSFLLR